MSYPATFDVESPDEIARWRPFVHWFLAIPHFVVAYVLGAVGAVLALIAWFSIVFTGRVSDGITNVISMIIRYNARIFAYEGFLHEEYPPFDFTTTASEPGGTPVTVDLRPELTDRNRLTVGLRFLWIIPTYFFTIVILFGASIIWFISAFVVLFTGKWNPGMRNFIVNAMGVAVRYGSYGYLLTDEYPPFSLDDPEAVSPPPAPAAQ